MIKCDKCQKIFKSSYGLTQHQKRIKNCLNKCPICLKIYSNHKNLKRHESVVCKQRYECSLCNKNYSSKYTLKYHCTHECKKVNKVNKVNTENKEIQPQDNQLNNIMKHAPDNKQMVVNITNIYNNNKINNNSNNKIGNKKIVNKVNFMETKPNYFEYDKYEGDKYREYNKLNEHFDEKMIDMYMYEESKFKENYKEALIFYEKRNLELEGFKMLHNQLQKDPIHQNVRIKKSKSGKCHVYKGEWMEVPLQNTITKICSKLCDSLYDKETSVNQFLRMVIASQPKRMIDLRKHIEKNIVNINNNKLIETEEESETFYLE